MRAGSNVQLLTSDLHSSLSTLHFPPWQLFSLPVFPVSVNNASDMHQLTPYTVLMSRSLNAHHGPTWWSNPVRDIVAISPPVFSIIWQLWSQRFQTNIHNQTSVYKLLLQRWWPLAKSVCRYWPSSCFLNYGGEHNSVLRRAEKTHHAWKGVALIQK